MNDPLNRILPLHSERSHAHASPAPAGPQDVTADEMDRELARIELKRADMNLVFEATLELLDQVDDPKELFDAILEEYSKRLDQFPGTPILPRAGHEMTLEQKQQLSLLVLFSSQAVLLKDKAQLFSQLRRKHHEVRKSTVLLSEALKDTEEVRSLLQATLENLPSGVVVFDRDGRHRFSNGGAEALLAAHPTLFPAADVYRTLFDEGAEPGASPPAETFVPWVEIEGPTGDTRTVHRRLVRLPAMAGREPLMILILGDVSEERRLHEEILRNGRLTAVLDTWAALNHEINNPLAAILGRAQILLSRSAGMDEKTVAGLRVIEESALRIVDLASRLKELTAPSVKEYSRGVTMLDIPALEPPGKRKSGT